MKRRWFIQTIAWLTVFIPAAEAFNPLPELVDVRAIYHEGQVIAELEFDSDISNKNVTLDFINQTIQADIEESSMPQNPIRKEYQAKGVKSVYTYKNKDNMVRSRIIFNKPVKASVFRNSVEIDKQGNTLKIIVHNPKLPPVVAEKRKIETKPSSLSSILVVPTDINDVTTSSNDVLSKEFADREKLQEQESPIEPKVIESQEFTRNIEKKIERAKPKVVAELKPVMDKSKDLKKPDLPEDQIPVFSEKKQVKASTDNSMVRMLGSLVVIVIFAIALTVALKWWSKKNTKSLNSTNIKVITQHYLGPKKSLAIVQVAGESILLGVTEQNINMIKTLSLIDDEIPDSLPNKFENVLDEMVADKPEFTTYTKDSVQKKVEKPEENAKANEKTEEYSMASIRNLVSSKLKNMRTIE